MSPKLIIDVTNHPIISISEIITAGQVYGFGGDYVIGIKNYFIVEIEYGSLEGNKEPNMY